MSPYFKFWFGYLLLMKNKVFNFNFIRDLLLPLSPLCLLIEQNWVLDSVEDFKNSTFRLAGDMAHLFGVLILLLKIHAIKSCASTFRSTVLGLLSLLLWFKIWFDAYKNGRRYFFEDAVTIRCRFCYSLLGYIYWFYIPIKYNHEVNLLG